MKWFSKIFLFCTLLFIIKSKAQLDTLNYLKQFEVNKGKYIGKPFAKLLSKLKYKIVISSLDNNGCYYASSFGFSKNTKTFMSMNIEWENSIVTTPLFFTNKKWLEVSDFTEEEKSFLEKIIIKDISVQNQAVSFGFLHCGFKKIPREFTKYLFDNKKNYIGKRFEDFLCNIKPVYFTEYKQDHNESGKIYKTTFFLNYGKVFDKDKRNKDSIQIIWKNPLNNKLLLDKNTLGTKEILLLRDEIISDIKVYR
ncbi:hypothetical protein GCM10023210_29420 [Chryseobacterium ginsengisoli]|uniref:DUF3108 domain-containing protein n=1 Tax=Chryseobacterium ginsengisoli TaxID=363853 RepID=A0ABP9MGX5_9FLAO